MSFSSSAVMTDIRKEQGWGQGSLRHVPVHGGGIPIKWAGIYKEMLEGFSYSLS